MNTEHLFKAAQKRGYQVARVKVKNERGTYDLFFLKDRQGRVLFGRFTGRFWFPPHVRGNKKKGIIEKDYAISTGQ